ncbi:MAG: PSD1 and planctomycete cytochrome C domain-containing protein, partial [Planctomycetaceae bacterium]
MITTRTDPNMRILSPNVTDTANGPRHPIGPLSHIGLMLAACSLISLHTDVFGRDKSELTFERDIRPIFRAHCFDCHGSQAEVEGGLDLRLVRFLKRGGDSGPAIVVGRPAESRLLKRVRLGEMPPRDAHLTTQEIDILQRWITAGAPTARPEPKTLAHGVGITSEEREFWAFQAIQRPEVTGLRHASRVRNPIDALLLSRMPEGLTFAPDADRFTLIKRLYLGLTGLPPSVESLEHWNHDPSPQWYEHLIEHLLNSPHYGERWARHWLDVAGYADSEGQTNSDAVRPWAWKYRDWVIRAFNDNLPFDDFLLHQLAGDELVGPRKGDLTSQQIALLTATGFLRMAADGTGSGANNPEARNKVVADTIRIVTSSLLGISVGCAQCHDHRYDPIPQTDYYALRAVFEPALDWQSWKPPSGRLISLYTQADRQQANKIEAEARQVLDEKNKKQTVYMKQALDQELEKYPQPLRDQLRAAYNLAGDKRSDAQKKLLKQHPSVNITPGVLYQYLPKAAEELKTFDKRAAEIRARKPKEEFIRALVEQENHAPVTYLFHRGDHRQPKQTVLPGGLTVTSPEAQRRQFPNNDPSLKTTGRRLAFARWLTSGQHRLVPRVIVNRIWMHHFGQGIVPTPSDFGRLGTQPTHPKLLDWLADEFVRRRWSLKDLHRLLLTSTAYRQSSNRDPAQASIDPGNRFYGRKSITRL